MIKEATYHEVHCDHCGEQLEMDGITAWSTIEDAKDALNYAGWQEMQSGKVFCESCLDHEYLFKTTLTITKDKSSCRQNH